VTTHPSIRNLPLHGIALALALAGTSAALPARAQGAPAAVSMSAPVLAPVAAASREPRFDLAVNNAPAAQVFMQLAMGSGWQLLSGPEVSGQITLHLRDTTVPEALEALRELYGYDYRISGRRIYVLPNTVQTRLFQVSYLPGRRQGTSDLHVSSASISAAGTNGNNSSSGSNGNPTGYSGSNSGNASSGGNNTSSYGNNAGLNNRNDDSSYVRTSSDTDFWRDVKSSLQALLSLGETGDGTGANAANTSGQRRSLVINAAAGVIVVRATPAELRQVEAYLQAVQINIERQVMLEAKILDVELGSESQSGVNWAAFGRALGSAVSLGLAQPGVTLSGSGALIQGATQITAGANLAAASGGAPFYGLAFQSGNFAALLSFLETQGKVQVLSSPRIATLNNQKAVLKVGSDELYVTGVASTTTSTGSTSTSTPSVILQPFFSGIALDVTPQIADDGQVMLHVHPSISTVSEKQKNINLGSLGSYQLPLASSTINETDSIVRVKDGQIVAIGGLMSQEQREDRSGVTGLSDVPVLGALFRQKTTVLHKRELVILIKPSVIRADGPWPEADTQTPAVHVQPWRPDAMSQLQPTDAEPPASSSTTPAARPVLRIDGTAN
jgi:MSHA biogenesis protein MshL